MNPDQLIPLLLDIQGRLGALDSKVDALHSQGVKVDALHSLHETRLSSLEHSRTRFHGVALVVGAIAGAVSSKISTLLGLH